MVSLTFKKKFIKFVISNENKWGQVGPRSRKPDDPPFNSICNFLRNKIKVRFISMHSKKIILVPYRKVQIDRILVKAFTWPLFVVNTDFRSLFFFLLSPLIVFHPLRGKPRSWFCLHYLITPKNQFRKKAIRGEEERKKERRESKSQW